MPWNDALNRRMMIISGKGGVGKSVVTATLAWVAAQQSKRTLVVELDTVETIPKIFGKPSGVPYQEQALTERISTIHVDGKSGLREYLQLMLKSKRFVRKIVQSPIYEYFVNIAPGLKELMAVGKLWDLEQKLQPGSDRRQYDLILVDTPATGHALSYLRMPMTAASTARGFVRKEAQKVADLLQDPAQTTFFIVTTLAEMPVNEAVDLYEKTRADLEFTVGGVFVNQVYPAFFEGADRDAFDAWSRRVGAGPSGGPAEAEANLERERVLLRCAEAWKRTRASQEEHLARLRSAIPCPLIFLPFVPAPAGSRELVEALARELREGENAS